MPRTSANPRTESIRLSMDPETKARLQRYAAQRRTSVSQLVVEWIWSVPMKEDASTDMEADRHKNGGGKDD